MANELPSIYIIDESQSIAAQAAPRPPNQPAGQGPEQGESHEITPLGPSLDHLSEQDRRLNQPKVNTSGPINWLGSSYSGADIKVVAHTYNTVESPETKQKEKATEELYADALDTLAGGGLSSFEAARQTARREGTINTWADLRKTWITSAFSGADAGLLSDGSIRQEVERRLETVLRRFVELPGTSAFSVFSARLALEAQDARAYAQNLEGIIQAWKELSYSASSTESIASIQTISIQTHREKFGARALGRSYVKGYTRGPRTIAGSMVLTVFDEHAFARLIKAVGNAAFIGESKLDTNVSSLIPDQLPPLDLTIVFANEYGSISRMGIYGVEFVNDSQTMSIEDLFTEEVVNFVARDVDIMTSVGKRKLSQLERGAWTTGEGRPLEGSELLKKTMLGKGSAYKDYLTRLGVRRSFRGR